MSRPSRYVSPVRQAVEAVHLAGGYSRRPIIKRGIAGRLNSADISPEPAERTFATSIVLPAEGRIADLHHVGHVQPSRNIGWLARINTVARCEPFAAVSHGASHTSDPPGVRDTLRTVGHGGDERAEIKDIIPQNSWLNVDSTPHEIAEHQLTCNRAPANGARHKGSFCLLLAETGHRFRWPAVCKVESPDVSGDAMRREAIDAPKDLALVVKMLMFADGMKLVALSHKFVKSPPLGKSIRE
mmetsp:Transcript_7845/g.20665  ORF Transcript_7845/g.20665 Transcript_7845/m.20665 type:complete len:242 (-) Transcript_7845:200-925(-)